MYGNSPYYYPEKFDLVPVGEIEMSEPCYSFDTVVVWRHTPTGDVYTARDSGCSCPTPFEDYDSLEQLTKLTSVNLDEFAQDLRQSYDQDGARDLLRKVRKELRR